MFDKTLCDCCVCPMQCICQQLAELGIEVTIFSREQRFNFFEIQEAKNFIVTGLQSGETMQSFLPTANISYIEIDETVSFNLKQIQKNIKGECACAEDPITNVAQSLINETVAICIQADDGDLEVIICDVGEGIVIAKEVNGTPMYAISSCAITGITPPTDKMN
ncbi:hypothetical protein [Chengkuizengella axinellae]|uniref:Uncharacterized protein n=1 Tax=Chengkuizengella axinellae TaxID=3064388 RepID=A0ABT9IWB3_9BACL|nr:hypothetical protein [Chengkuizengella sp. 2205SS18-9]MDP5273653.1 hypothetical protein [Chengkuizengella sp. 2205SS18-9]